jgi:hypothetical protein
LVLDRPREALPLLLEAESFWTDFDAASRWAGLTHFWLAQVYLALDQQADAARSLAQAENVLADSAFPSDQRLLRSPSNGAECHHGSGTIPGRMGTVWRAASTQQQ